MRIITLHVNGQARAVPIDGAAVRSCQLPATVGNAVFDAAGIRLRTASFTPARVEAALRTAAI